MWKSIFETACEKCEKDWKSEEKCFNILIMKEQLSLNLFTYWVFFNVESVIIRSLLQQWSVKQWHHYQADDLKMMFVITDVS